MSKISKFSKMSEIPLPPNPFPSTPLGTVLIIGGTGTLGSAIAHHLLTAPMHADTSDVHILSRNAPSPSIRAFLPGVTYHHMSITDESSISTLLATIKPAVIFHTFSPRYTSDAETLYQGNVVGTTVLLRCVSHAPSVKALVYSSSDSVMQVLRLHDGETILTEATCRPVNPADPSLDAYCRTKTIADALVLAANNNNKNNNSATLKTACVRFGTMYGEGDTQNLPQILDQLRQKQQKVQVGPNEAPRECIYVPSNAYAHVLAAQALLHGVGVDGGRVDGEVFFVSDAEGGRGAMPFWDFMRLIWRAAGDRTEPREVTVVPIWVARWVMGVTEWVYWVATLGYVKPDVTWAAARYMFMPVRFDISKAVARLGYVPLMGVEEGIQRGVDWMVENGWTRE